MHISWKWRLKSKVYDFKYARDLLFYSLSRRERSKPLVRYSAPGSIPSSYDNPVCLFCTYDKESFIRDSVYYYLNELVLSGFDVVFISSSETIINADLKKLSGLCIKIINRENKGYDFYGWKTGLEEYPQYSAHSGLLLANDSVLGPLFSIRNIINEIENCNADVVGMTDSFLYYPHLQSYFIFCKKSVVLSEEFIRFFNQVSETNLKIAIIRKYEVGFSRLLGHRFRLSALYNVEHAFARARDLERPQNWMDPTFRLWKLLITEFKFPFLKKNVLTGQDISIQEISAVLAESGSTFDIGILAGWIWGKRPSKFGQSNNNQSGQQTTPSDSADSGSG